MSSMYPEVIVDQPSENTDVQVTKVAENLFPDNEQQNSNNPSEEILIEIPDATVHLIDKTCSVELASGEFSIVRLGQGETIVAVLARIGDQIQWPLAKDEAAVKLDENHYFFSLRAPGEELSTDNILNYGLTIKNSVRKGNNGDLDGVLRQYSLFTVGKVTGDEVAEGVEYWTSVAPDVEEYGSCLARAIAGGSVRVAKGVLWIGDKSVDGLNWGHEFLRRSIGEGSSEVSPEALRRVERVKNLTKKCESVATGILSGVVKVSGFFTGYIVNSVVGKKFFSLMPGEIVLATLDGFNKVFDAVEVSGRNVMSTTSTVTTGLVTQRYGDGAGKVTNVGLDAAGHAIGAAWAVFKIRKAINPKNVIKPTTIVKTAAKAHSSDLKAKSKKQ